MKEKFDVAKHVLVPKHKILSKKETQELLEKYKITIEELPQISLTDAAIAGMKPSKDDVIKIERASPTAGRTVFYRRAVK